MKAIQINAYGGNEVFEFNPNAPKPTPTKKQVLVEVYAASINHFDAAVRAGYVKDMMPVQFPATLGGDFSGVVIGVGEGVNEFTIGDLVYGSALLFSGGSGAFAEVLVANTKNIALKPKSVNFVEAASLPLVGVSALQALAEHIKLARGQRILIHGGAGGIGTIAIQLAKSLGVFVATTVRGNDKNYVTSLGVDQAIDYRNEKFENLLKDFDAVFDTVGGETTERSFKVLKKGGTLVSMKGQPNPELAQKYGVTAVGQRTNTNTERLTGLAELVDRGKIKPQVDKVFPLEQTREACVYYEEGHPRGKVVLKIKG